MRNFVASLAKSIVVCIIEDRAGNYVLYGSENGLQASTKHELGTKESDHNQWTITLTATELYNALPVSASVMVPYTI
jgi:hypothetical protein